MGFNKILVALDRSPVASSVFERALELAIQHRSVLMLAHYLDQASSNHGPDVASLDFTHQPTLRSCQPTHAEVNAQVREWLSNYCLRATEWDVAAQFICGVGNPAL